MTTWILLRGLTREAGHWGAFVDDLKQVLPTGTRILMPDIAGNGRAHHIDSPVRVEAMAQWLRQHLRQEGVSPPYHVLAMSLGAMVTVAWAHAHPNELSGCVLINTSLRPYSPFWHRLQTRQYPTVLRLLLQRPDDAALERAILGMTCRHPRDIDATLARWVKLRQQHPVSMRNALRQLWAAARYRAPMQAPAVPTLLLHAAGDQLVHPRCTQAIAARWGTTAICHPSAGHDLPQDDGPWVAQEVGRWLQAQQAQRPA